MSNFRQQVNNFMEKVKEHRNLDEVTSNGRFYKIVYDGKIRIYPSVTTIIDSTVAKGKGYEKWLGNARSYRDAQEYANERAELGTKVHKHCEELANGMDLVTEEWGEEEIKLTIGFKKFMEEETPNQIVATETLAMSDKFGYAGSADLLVKNSKNEHVLIDIKTSSYIYRSHKVQLSMYKDAFEEFGIDIDKVKILKLKKNGYSLKDIDYDDSYTVGTMLIYEATGRKEPRYKENLPKKISLDIENTPTTEDIDSEQDEEVETTLV